VQGLVTGPTAGDQRHLALLGRVLAHDDLVRGVVSQQVAVGRSETFQRFLDDRSRIVEELPHLVGFDCHCAFLLFRD